MTHGDLAALAIADGVWIESTRTNGEKYVFIKDDIAPKWLYNPDNLDACLIGKVCASFGAEDFRYKATKLILQWIAEYDDEENIRERIEEYPAYQTYRTLAAWYGSNIRRMEYADSSLAEVQASTIAEALQNGMAQELSDIYAIIVQFLAAETEE